VSRPKSLDRRDRMGRQADHEDDMVARDMRTGELARRAGISADTLRHYERLGLLPEPERTPVNYRRYAPEALDRLSWIRNGLAMGFSLAELRRILDVLQRGGTPCRGVMRLALEKLQRLDKQIDDLVRYRHELRAILADWDRRLGAASRSSRARLLQSLPAPPHRPSIHRFGNGVRKGSN
jgi:DNA-binding transcriptional MerR regulator